MRWLDGIINSMNIGLGKSPGVGDGQGGLAYCGSWGCKESDTTERLNETTAGVMRDFSQSAFIIMKTKSAISLTPLKVISFCLSVP